MGVLQGILHTWSSLSKKQRRQLRSFASGAADAGFRCRCQIVLAWVQRQPATLIAVILQCSRTHVYEVARRFVAEGPTGLADKREDNGAEKVTGIAEMWIERLVAGSPTDHGHRRPTWTQELLVQVLDEKTGIRVSITTMSRTLKRLHIRRGRPKPYVLCPWRKRRRQRKLLEIRRLVAGLPAREVAVYVDEVDIHLNPKIGPDYMLRGTQKTVRTPGQNQKRYLAGALNARTGKLTWVEWERKTSDLFILLFGRLEKEYPQARKIHLILDNYKIHKSARTQLALGTTGGRVQLHFLPPYCPDDNRIERTWRDLHDNVTRNHRCASMADLMAEVHDYLRRKSRILMAQYKKPKLHTKAA